MQTCGREYKVQRTAYHIRFYHYYLCLIKTISILVFKIIIYAYVTGWSAITEMMPEAKPTEIIGMTTRGESEDN